MNFKITTVFNSLITVHWTLPLYMLFVVSQVGWQLGIPLMLAIFGSVLLHELGHVFVAQKRGIQTGEINLNLFGGMASMRLDSSVAASDELLMAVAGPAVSLALAGVSFAMGLLIPINGFQHATGYFCAANLVLALFNMLPAIPMDGGRVLRSLLRYKLTYIRATRVSVYVAYVIFAALAVVAMMWHQWFFVAMMGILALGAALECKRAEA